MEKYFKFDLNTNIFLTDYKNDDIKLRWYFDVITTIKNTECKWKLIDNI